MNDETTNRGGYAVPATSLTAGDWIRNAEKWETVGGDGRYPADDRKLARRQAAALRAKAEKAQIQAGRP